MDIHQTDAFPKMEVLAVDCGPKGDFRGICDDDPVTMAVAAAYGPAADAHPFLHVPLIEKYQSVSVDASASFLPAIINTSCRKHPCLHG